MKILHLLNSIKPGGAENVVANYIQVCNELGYDSVVVGTRNSEAYELQLKEIAKIEYSLSKSVLINSDVIFVHSNINLLRLIRFLPILKKKQIKVIYIQHLFFSERKFKVLAQLINQICTDFVKITPLIEPLVTKYVKIPVHDINNFYLNRYLESQWPEIRQTVRKGLGIDSTTKLVCFSAIFKFGKGLKDVINLAKSMSKDENVRFLIVGDGQEAHLLEGYPYNNLIWVGRQNDVEKYLIASDVYLFTSNLKEMMPMALIEAINTNKQIFAYDTLINRHLLGENVFDKISRMSIMSGVPANGIEVVHYDRNYGTKKLRDLIEVN